MQTRVVVTMLSSVVTAMATAMLLSVDAAEARTTGWECGLLPDPMGCFAGNASCRLGTTVLDPESPTGMSCDTQSMEVSDCCKQGAGS